MKKLKQVGTKMVLHVQAYKLKRVISIMGIAPLIASDEGGISLTNLYFRHNPAMDRQIRPLKPFQSQEDNTNQKSNFNSSPEIIRLTVMNIIGNGAAQESSRWLNNRAENSHQPFRRREVVMSKFRDIKTL